jgi:head-tail adaptor
LKEARTGATRYNQGLDAGSLNKTASGIRQIMNATQKKTLLIARTFAETGLRSLFMGIHRDLRAGPVKELAIKLRGQWVQTNPRLWADRTDMTIRVGGISREEKRGALMLIAQFQEKLAMSGSRLVGEQHMFETARELAASVGYRNPARFFADPASLPPPQPPPPDPMAQMAQAQLQLAQQDMQNRFTLQAQKLQQDGEKMMAEMQVKLRELARKEVETASRVQTDDERLELDRKRVVLDDDFKRDKLEVDAVTGAMRAAPKAATSAPPIDYGDV